jgi:hypothetical protein
MLKWLMKRMSWWLAEARGGHAAAVAAARNGARTIRIERYGVLGGMATGGVVTIIPNMSGMEGKQQIIGQTQEWIDR